MPTKFYVIKETPCSKCNGEGIVQNWQWQQFWKDHPNGFPPKREFDDWWRERVSRDKRGYLAIPAEEDNCPDCDGSQVIRSEVSLAEAVEAIKGVAR